MVLFFRVFVFVVYTTIMVYMLIPTVKADVLTLSDVFVDYKHFLPNGYSPYMPKGSTLNKEIDLHVNTELLRYAYWNNQVWSLWDQSQVRWFGWEYEVGVHVTDSVDVFYNHFSRHEADKQNKFMQSYGEKYPVEDSIGFRFYFYSNKDRRGLL